MKIRLTLMTILILALGTGIASAFPLWPGVGTIAGTEFEDDDVDYFVETDQPFIFVNDQEVPNPAYGIISPGDVLIAGIEGTYLRELTGPTPRDVYALNQSIDELVALAVVQVASIVTTGDPLSPYVITFQEYNNTPMLRFYTGGVTDFSALNDPLLTLTNAINAISGDASTYLWGFSITSDLDTQWLFNATNANALDPSVVADMSAKVGTVNFALNQVYGDSIFQNLAIGDDCQSLGGVFSCAGNGLVQMVGSADIRGANFDDNTVGIPGAPTDWSAIYPFALSDAEARMNPIPEPSTLVLLGLGLLGAGMFCRRRS